MLVLLYVQYSGTQIMAKVLLERDVTSALNIEVVLYSECPVS